MRETKDSTCPECRTTKRPTWCYECGQNHGAAVEIIDGQPMEVA